MIALKQLNNFNNFNQSTVLTADAQRTLVSPLGTYLLRYSQNQNINLFNLTDYSQIPVKINTKNTTFLRAAFSFDEQQIFFTNKNGIFAYSILNQTISSIIAHNTINRITDYKFNPNFSILYYLNQSQLYSFNYTARSPMFNGTKLSKPTCLPDRFAYDPNTNIIITSSVSQTTCIVCKWKVQDKAFAFVDSQIFNAGCFLNDLYIFGDQLAITKKNFNSVSFGNTVLVNITTLNTMTITNETNEGPSRPGFIVPYHNYYLQYFSGSNYIFVYKDSLMNNYFNISNQFVKSVAYNPVKEEFYVVSKTQRNLDVITTFKPIFDCLSVTGSLTQSQEPDCMCVKGHLFNKQNFACEKPNCFGSQGQCKCPKGQTFNNFNLQCEVKCSNMANAMPVQAYGKPARCFCMPQFSWNDKEIGCYNLSNDYKQPTSEEKSASHAGVIIVVIIIILLLIAAALLYYYKKCKNQANQQEENNGKQEIESDRQMSQKPKSNPTLESNEHLKSREQKIEEPHQGPKEFIHNTQPEDLQKFSIDDDDGEKQEYFSKIESNIQNHLT